MSLCCCLPVNSRQLDSFTTLCRPCSGASGFVQLVLDTETDEQVAIKFIERGGRTSQRIIARELLNHRECAMHPHIIQLKASTAAWDIVGLAGGGQIAD